MTDLLAPPEPRRSTAEVMTLLAKRFAAPAWAFLPELRNGTGYARTTRTADAFAMSLWPSRGLELHGCEVKVSRADWLRELKAPVKAEEMFAYCHRWWLVVGDRAIVQAGELPPTWGLLVPRGDRLVAEVEAPKLDAKPPSVSLLAAILRDVSESWVSKASIADQLNDARAAGIEKGKADGRFAAAELAALQKRLAEFKAESGVDIDGVWAYGNIGRAVRETIQRGPEAIRRSIEGHKAWAERIVSDCTAILADTEGT